MDLRVGFQFGVKIISCWKAASTGDVPDGLEDSTWGGVVSDSSVLCHHGHPPRRRYSWEGRNTSRRFLGCPLEVLLGSKSIWLELFVVWIIL